MKKVINGKVYDTETAQKMGEWDNGHYTNDFQYCAETLFKKRTGEFFLFGEGHALSKYAGHSGNMSGWGEKIIPYSYEEAQKWAEEHLDGDEYIEIFGIPDEGADDVQLNLTISASTASKFKKIAQERSITQKELFEALVKEA